MLGFFSFRHDSESWPGSFFIFCVPPIDLVGVDLRTLVNLFVSFTKRSTNSTFYDINPEFITFVTQPLTVLKPAVFEVSGVFLGPCDFDCREIAVVILPGS